MSHDSDAIRRRLRALKIKPDAANVARVQRSEAAVGPGERNRKFLEERAKEQGRFNQLHDYRDPSRSIHREAFKDPSEVARMKREAGRR